MKALILSLTVASAAVFARPSAAQTPQPASSQTIPDCRESGVTAPVPQTQISLSDAYPPMSVVLNEEGATVVGFTVRSNGTLDDVKVEGTSGSLRLDDAAVNSVRQVLYSRPMRDGHAIDCHGHMRIVWKLTDDPATQAYKPRDAVVLSPPRSLYPAKALAERREGATAVTMIVGADGRLADMRIVKSSGSDDLDAASLAYLKTLALSPAKIDGKTSLSFVAAVVAWSTYPSQTAKDTTAGSARP